MSKYGETGTATGQAFRVKAVETIATALALPIADYSKLAIKADPINKEDISGKQAGAMVLAVDSANSKMYIAVATGHLPDSPWHCVELDATVTPAA